MKKHLILILLTTLLAACVTTTAPDGTKTSRPDSKLIKQLAIEAEAAATLYEQAKGAQQ